MPIVAFASSVNLRDNNVLYSNLYLQYDVQVHEVQPRWMAIPVTSLVKITIFLNSEIVKLYYS